MFCLLCFACASAPLEQEEDGTLTNLCTQGKLGQVGRGTPNVQHVLTTTTTLPQLLLLLLTQTVLDGQQLLEDDDEIENLQPAQGGQPSETGGLTVHHIHDTRHILDLTDTHRLPEGALWLTTNSPGTHTALDTILDTPTGSTAHLLSGSSTV